MKTTIAAFLLAAAAGAPSAQTPAPFDPFPGGSAQYHFDLARTFYPSPDAERRERDITLAVVARAAAFADSAPRSARALLAMLRAADTVDARLAKHYSYLSLRGSIDTRNDTAQLEMNQLNTAAQSVYRTVTSVIATLPADRFSAFAREVPDLERYRFAFERARLLTPPRSPASSGAGDRARAVHANDGNARFMAAFAWMDFGSIPSPEGVLDVRAQMSVILNHPSRAVREAGWRRNLQALRTRLDTFAAIITQTADSRNILARLRGYADHREESYGANFLTKEQVMQLLLSLREAAAHHKESERVRDARMMRTMGIDKVEPWDMYAPAPGRSAPRFTAPQAISIIVSAAQPLGASYASELRTLLDPRNGRLDIAPAPYRVERPGFSTGLVGFPSMFYQGRFSGFIEDVLIMAHEAGHGAQNMMMDHNGVLPRYANGPSYFTESYAALAELVLLDYLRKRETDPAQQTYYLERLLTQTADVFRNGAEALFEDHVYDSVAAGRMLNADQLERLFQETGKDFSTRFGPGTTNVLAWLQPLQFYTRPLYRINYVYSRLLALGYFAKLQADPAGFARRYQSLLSRGYDAPPAELLKAEMGIDLSDAKSLVAGAVRMIDVWTRELKRQ